MSSTTQRNGIDATAGQTDRLTAEVAHLRWQIADLTGEAEQREAAALRHLLERIRWAQGEVRPEGKWHQTMLVVGYTLALELPGEHSTVEEFTAKADSMAARQAA